MPSIIIMTMVRRIRDLQRFVMSIMTGTEDVDDKASKFKCEVKSVSILNFI